MSAPHATHRPIEIPRTVRLHRLVDFARSLGCDVQLAGNGALRLVERTPTAEPAAASNVVQIHQERPA